MSEDKVIELKLPPNVTATEDVGLWQKFGQFLWESTLLVLIYILFSVDGVQNLVSTFISNLGLPEKGILPLTGQLIYAIMFAIIFIAIRKLLS